MQVSLRLPEQPHVQIWLFVPQYFMVTTGRPLPAKVQPWQIGRGWLTGLACGFVRVCGRVSVWQGGRVAVSAANGKAAGRGVHGPPGERQP